MDCVRLQRTKFLPNSDQSRSSKVPAFYTQSASANSAHSAVNPSSPPRYLLSDRSNSTNLSFRAERADAFSSRSLPACPELRRANASARAERNLSSIYPPSTTPPRRCFTAALKGETKAKRMFAFYSPCAILTSGVFNRSRPRPLAATAKPVILSVSMTRTGSQRNPWHSGSRTSGHSSPAANNDSAAVNRMVNSATRYEPVTQAKFCNRALPGAGRSAVTQFLY